jgi:S1-C subfamily serine protease
MRRIADLSEDTINHLATVPERPQYVKVASPSMSPGASGPTLGIRPDYGDDGDGVLVGGVAEGRPAEKAGLKAGDRIVEIAGKPVKSLTGYVELMRTHKSGDTIEVAVLRDKEKKVFKVKLD